MCQRMLIGSAGRASFKARYSKVWLIRSRKQPLLRCLNKVKKFMESIYWVLSRDCNQRCPHCYNNSEPGAPGLEIKDVATCVANLPDPGSVPVGRIILSGGEVLVWPELLFHTLHELHQRFNNATSVWIQTNGDLLDESMLARLLDAGVRRIDIASMDKYHWKSTAQRRGYLEKLFDTFRLLPADRKSNEMHGESIGRQVEFAFWGATEDEWIGPLWPRGRAHQKSLSKATPNDRFCSNWSGAKGFLDYMEVGSEVNIQLADVYPCCPMTCRPIGNLARESLIDMLDRCRTHPVYRALNDGRPEAMGEYLGISEAHGFERSRALGNHCLWCDEFFTKHAPDLLEAGGITERGSVDLVQIGLSHR